MSYTPDDYLRRAELHVMREMLMQKVRELPELRGRDF